VNRDFNGEREFKRSKKREMKKRRLNGARGEGSGTGFVGGKKKAGEQKTTQKKNTRKKKKKVAWSDQRGRARIGFQANQVREGSSSVEGACPEGSKRPRKKEKKVLRKEVLTAGDHR